MTSIQPGLSGPQGGRQLGDLLRVRVLQLSMVAAEIEICIASSAYPREEDLRRWLAQIEDAHRAARESLIHYSRCPDTFGNAVEAH